MTSPFNVDQAVVVYSSIDEFKTVQSAMINKLKTLLIFVGPNIRSTNYLTKESIAEVNAFIANTKEWTVLHLGKVYNFQEDSALDENPDDNIKLSVGSQDSFAYILNLFDTSNKQYVYTPHLYTNCSIMHSICNNNLITRFFSRIGFIAMMIVLLWTLISIAKRKH